MTCACGWRARKANAASTRIGQQKNIEKAAQAELEQAILNSVSIGEPPDLYAADAGEADERAAAAELEQRALEAGQHNMMNRFASQAGELRIAFLRDERSTRTCNVSIWSTTIPRSC